MSRSQRQAGVVGTRGRPLDLGGVVTNASRWLFLGTLVYAPWAYGCTTAATIVILNWLLGAVLILWGIALLIRRETPRLPWRMVVPLAAALFIGWAVALNARAIYDPTFGIYVPLQAPFPNLPGSYDAALSVASMTRLTLLAGMLCFAAALSLRPVWLLRLWCTIGVAGASIASLGLLQKATGAKMIFWQPWHEWVWNFFGPFYYHANAGAYLNLILPLTLGLTLRSFFSGSAIARALWTSAGLLVVAAVLANTSRMAQLLALVVVLAFAAWPARTVFRITQGVNRVQLAAGIAVVLVALVAVAQAIQLDQPIKRWQTLGKTLAEDARWPAAATAWHALPDAGWLGLGPGAFRAVFPPYQQRAGAALEGEWRFLHDDYLQTLLEWGRSAVVLFAVAFSGIGVALWSRHHAQRNWLPRQRAIIPLIVIALGSVAAHSAVDFPLQIASIQLYAATYLGICWGSARWRILDQGVSGDRRKCVTVAKGVVLQPPPPAAA